MTSTLSPNKIEYARNRRLICLILLISAAFLLASGFRPGLKISVGGETLPGVYRPSEVLISLMAAEEAAGEILHKNVDLEGVIKVRPALSAGGRWGEAKTLQRALIEQLPGITFMYAVKIEGELVGWVKDRSELGEILDTILAENCQPGTVSAGFKQKVKAEFSYVPLWAEPDSVAVSKALRDSLSVEVTNIDPYAANEA
jgi:hypothetical protein